MEIIANNESHSETLRKCKPGEDIFWKKINPAPSKHIEPPIDRGELFNATNSAASISPAGAKILSFAQRVTDTPPPKFG